MIKNEDDMSKIKIVIEEDYYEEYSMKMLCSQELILYKNDDKIDSYTVKQDEPEDMCFGRSLEDVASIEKMLKMAYEAGKNGDEIEFETIDVSE